MERSGACVCVCEISFSLLRQPERYYHFPVISNYFKKLFSILNYPHYIFVFDAGNCFYVKNLSSYRIAPDIVELAGDLTPAYHEKEFGGE